MKQFLSIIISTVATVLTVNYLVFAQFTWQGPTADPPNENVAAPLNVGAGRQTKVGDLTLNNLKATSITLGGDTRFAWPGGSGGSAGCAWEGKKCACFYNGGDIDGRLVIGTTCRGGALVDFDIVNFATENTDISPCPRVPPPQWGCAPSLYSRK